MIIAARLWSINVITHVATQLAMAVVVSPPPLSRLAGHARPPTKTYLTRGATTYDHLRTCHTRLFYGRAFSFLLLHTMLSLARTLGNAVGEPSDLVLLFMGRAPGAGGAGRFSVGGAILDVAW